MRHIIGLVPVLAVASVAAAMAILPGGPPARAQGAGTGDRMVWRSGTSTIQLTDQPCPFAEFSSELEEWGIPPARAFELVQTGRPTVPGCWIPDYWGDVLTRDISGHGGMVPADWFRREPNA